MKSEEDERKNYQTIEQKDLCGVVMIAESNIIEGYGMEKINNVNI